VIDYEFVTKPILVRVRGERYLAMNYNNSLSLWNFDEYFKKCRVRTSAHIRPSARTRWMRSQNDLGPDDAQKVRQPLSRTWVEGVTLSVATGTTGINPRREGPRTASSRSRAACRRRCARRRADPLVGSGRRTCAWRSMFTNASASPWVDHHRVRPRRAQTLAKGDKLTVTLERIDGGKLRCAGATWSAAVVVLPRPSFDPLES
jgi:hypothetical protein